MRLGGLEAGGTKMVLSVGDENGEIFATTSIPTGRPEDTVPQMVKWFAVRNIEALGIGTFGPVDVNPDSQTYGSLLETPKPGWAHFNLLSAFKNGIEDKETGEYIKGLKVPMKIDTDVNGSCLGEMTFGTAKGLSSVLYLTVGTGIGAGFSVDGKLAHGMLHPEAGHIRMLRHPKDKGESVCPFHPDCFEGLASGPSIEKRWGKKAVMLSDNDEVWEIESYYIAQALTDYIYIVSPQKIILGGGVMHQMKLFPLIREQVTRMLNGYLKTPELADMDSYIVPNSLDDNQGILGAMQLGYEAARKKESN
ncbi:MAG: ROK family protein [Catonella sp.]|jgi:fructokinase|nr:ROK family protein [Catonella sp.]MDY6357137.1 ROK family protein [Catonella sp.]